MKVIFQKILYKIKTKLSLVYKKSYSQNGEDIILSRVFKNLGIQKIFYLDIGTNDPKIINNTYLLYRKGNSGVCIEPDPNLYNLIKKARPRDLVLNIAISDRHGKLPYFIFKSNVRNTLSKEDAQITEAHGYPIKKIINVETKTINDIIESLPQIPDLISLDIEGYDEKVLLDFDFKRFKPLVWCIETIEITKNKYRKNKRIEEIMKNNNYGVYADTNINTIFVRNDELEKIYTINK
jgi:FkbM family methyltransferase